MTRPRTAACLCLTGGGALVRFTTEVLEGLQALRDPVYPSSDAGRPLVEAFDILAGTSAGALVIGGLALGRSPARMSEVLETHAPLIFPGGWHRTLRWFATSKYDPGPLREAVDEVLDGDTRTLGEFNHWLAFTTINETLGVPVTLTNANPDHLHIPLRDAVLASAAAPTYFPAHRIEVLDNHRFIDGGLYANAPDLVALSLALRKWNSLRIGDIHVTSIGTTFAPSASPYPPSNPGAWGVLTWAARPPGRILKLAMRGTTDHAIDLMESLPLADFTRIDAPMTGLDLDTATPAAFQQLAHAGRSALNDLSEVDMDALKEVVRRRRAT